MIRTIFIAIIIAIGIKAGFAVASFAHDQRAARLYILNQGDK